MEGVELPGVVQGEPGVGVAVEGPGGDALRGDPAVKRDAGVAVDEAEVSFALVADEDDGLGAGDVSTAPLRRYLSLLGHSAYGWGLGTNIGPTAKISEGTPARLRAIHQEEGRAVTVIGWSLGGILARRLAREMPEMVRQVITLGSPIRIRTHDHSHGRRLYEMFEGRHVEQFAMPLEEGLDPLPMPTTSIYSRLDGIVSWHACLDVETDRSENIEVRAAHLGLGYQAAALYAVADRLAQPVGHWEPFVPPPWARRSYPPPAERVTAAHP